MGASITLRPGERAEARLIAGRYRVDAALGHGGGAKVFRVTDTARDTPLALKRLRNDAPRGLVALFDLEYQILASYRHPQMVEVYEYGRDQGSAFYTMELLQGTDLSRCGVLAWRDACVALRDAALALGVLHSRNLVHRDVSPRNLWRLPNGRVKLIDFGALAAFGLTRDVIGTVPLVPPESLNGRALDQRADLYALGAVGYYVLTGIHAYPARELSELPELWSFPLAAPSSCVATLERADPEPIPPELDALLLALLSQNPLARPSSTNELIDRLDALLGSAHSRSDAPVDHLAHPAFIGRSRERRHLRRLLLLAAQFRGQSVVIESESGMGRTRLMNDFALEARVADAVVLQVDAASYPEEYGVASALALKLLDALPEVAKRAATRFATTLAHISARVGERLGVAPSKPSDVPGELRVKILDALRDWFVQLTAEHTLVVLVDGLELIDASSGAFLLALALARQSSRVLLACTALPQSSRPTSAAERALRHASRRVAVLPLSQAETVQLLRSVFGRTEHLARLASHLYSNTAGNPGQTMHLTAQLVRSEAIVFSNGTWVLPQEIPPEQLTNSREQGLLTRLDSLVGQPRQLACALSVQSGVISAELCHTLADDLSVRADGLMSDLCELGILLRDENGVRFAHEQLRLRLLAELAPARRRLALRMLGEHFLGLPRAGAFERLRGSVHLFESGDMAAAELVARASLQIALYEPDRLTASAPVIEHALVLFRGAGRPEHEVVALLAPLGMAGFFVDRRYSVAYGDAALASLQEVLGLDLAKTLSAKLGRHVAIVTALSIVGARFATGRGAIPGASFPDALLLLFMTVSALTASNALCYDKRELAARRSSARALRCVRLGSTRGGVLVRGVSRPRDRSRGYVRRVVRALEARRQSVGKQEAHPRPARPRARALSHGSDVLDGHLELSMRRRPRAADRRSLGSHGRRAVSDEHRSAARDVLRPSRQRTAVRALPRARRATRDSARRDLAERNLDAAGRDGRQLSLPRCDGDEARVGAAAERQQSHSNAQRVCGSQPWNVLVDARAPQ